MIYVSISSFKSSSIQHDVYLVNQVHLESQTTELMAPKTLVWSPFFLHSFTPHFPPPPFSLFLSLCALSLSLSLSLYLSLSLSLSLSLPLCLFTSPLFQILSPLLFPSHVHVLLINSSSPSSRLSVGFPPFVVVDVPLLSLSLRSPSSSLPPSTLPPLASSPSSRLIPLGSAASRKRLINGSR